MMTSRHSSAGVAGLDSGAGAQWAPPAGCPVLHRATFPVVSPSPVLCRLGALGFKFQFITLAGFHSLNFSMFSLAHDYARRGGLLLAACHPTGPCVWARFVPR